MTPVKKQLKRYITSCGSNDEYQRQLDSLSRVVSSTEWKIVIQLLWMIKNEMAVELLQSQKYTKDLAESKDVTQKVYHNIGEWIDFLTNPNLWIREKGMIQILTNKLKGDKPERKEL
jgi:hypothetical protein